MEPPSVDLQARLLEAISDLDIGVLVAKGQRFVYANPAAGRLSGFDPGELTSSASFFDFAAPEERERLKERLRRHFEGSTADHFEMNVRLRDGRRVDLELAVKLLPGPGAFVVLYRDITARKAEETRLRHAEKMAAVGRLLAGVAHDINTPLAVVLSNMDVSGEELDKTLASGRPLTMEQTGALRDRLHVNRAHLRRIATSVRRLQGLGSPQAPKRVPTDVRPLLVSVVGVARFAAHGRCDVRVDLPDLPLVACDGEVVAHAVQHVLTNAIEAARSEVGLSARTDGGWLEVVVEDDGPGFPPEALERVFEPFFTTKPAGNMGLGLTLARAIAQDHAGSLAASNRPEGGARLTMRIPLEGA